MPPTRRRPVPTPPAGGRPKVAGLSKRATTPADPDSADAAALADSAVEPAAATPADLGNRTADDTHEPLVSPDDTKGPRVPTEDRVEEVADGAVEEEAPATVEYVPARPGWLLPAALVVVALLLGGLGFWFQQRSGTTSYDAALVDANATSEVNGQVREGVEKAFSYNFADVSATEKAANELLTGKAKCQYNAVFGPVKTLAPQQKLVVTVKVVASAVSSLKDDHATVLVFVDQVTTRTTDNQTGGGTAMLRAGAQKTDGRWKIDNMEMFGQTPEQTEQMRACQ